MINIGLVERDSVMAKDLSHITGVDRDLGEHAAVFQEGSHDPVAHAGFGLIPEEVRKTLVEQLIQR